MRWLGSITDLTDMSKLQETVEHKGVWHAAVHGVAKSWTQLNNKGHLAMSGNVSVVTDMGVEGEMGLPSIQWAEARGAANILQSIGQPLASDLALQQTLIGPQMSRVLLLLFPALTGNRNDQLQQNLPSFELVPGLPRPPQHPSLPRPKEMLLTVWSRKQQHQHLQGASYRRRTAGPSRPAGLVCAFQ